MAIDSADLRRERIREALVKHAVRRGEFRLASGRVSDVYIDCKPVVLRHWHIADIASMLYRLMETSGIRLPQLVAGVPVGGVPLATAVSLVSGGPELDIVIVRKEAKDHGSGRLIELPADPHGWDAVLVEDVITTGASSIAAVGALRGVGINVLGVYSIIDRELGGREAIEALGVVCRSLFTVKELLDA